MPQVTDPAILAQLNAGSAPQPVTDPAILAQLNGAPSTAGAAPNTLMDMVKGFGSGLVSLPRQLAGEVIAELKKDHIPLTPTAQAVSNFASNAYQPQTILGQTAETAGQFLPAAFGGEGGLAARAMSVALPTAGAEGAGLLSSGGKLQGQSGLARALGSFVGIVPALWGAASNAMSAGKPLLDAAGENPQTTATALDTNAAPVPGLTYTAAQATQDPALAALEKQSRMANPASWTENDTAQNAALVNALKAATANATDDDVASTRDALNSATAPMRKAAIEAIPEGTDLATPIRAAAQSELDSGRGTSPAVQSVANYVLKNAPEPTVPETDPWNGASPFNPATAIPETVAQGEATSSLTPDRAYTIRKQLADALNKNYSISNSDLTNSIKGAGVSSVVMKNAIDDALNQASGGAWQDYLDAYKAQAPNVTSVEALNNIRSDLLDKANTGLLTSTGDPKLTRAFITNTIAKYATNKFGSTLQEPAATQLGNISTAAQQMESPLANLRGAQTGGGGSDTASNLLMRYGSKMLGPLGPIISTAKDLVTSSNAKQLAAALQDHAAAATMLRDQIARQAATAAALRGVGTAGLLAPTQLNQGQNP